MKKEIILISLIMCSCAVFAQTTGDDKSIFGEKEIALPPRLPSDEIKSELILIVKDMEQNVIGNKHVLLGIENPEKDVTETTIRYSDVDGKIILNLEPGSWQITAKIDDLSTPGKDYTSSMFTIKFENSTVRDLFMLPVGSLRGSVYNKQGERIANAKIKADCGRDYGDENTVSDDFGSFSLQYLPVGKCDVSALSDNKVGFETVNITQGELDTVNIILGQEVKSGFDLTLPLIAVSLVVILTAILYLTRKRAGETRKEIRAEKGVKIELNDRMRDIIQTLNGRESDIINLLIENNGKLTQAEIRHFLGIPKATISRDIYSLEQKKIIETIKIGRNKEIILSKWFLDLKK